MEIEAVLLTGGASSRMGSDKANLQVQGIPLAAKIAGQIRALGIPLTVLGLEPLPGHEFLGDAEHYSGPLVALSRFTPQREAVFVASCDLVRFDARLIGQLTGAMGQSDAVIPVIEGRLQPLCALYRRESWGRLSQAVTNGKRSIMAWIESLQFQQVDELGIAGAGLDPRCVLGANTPEEFAQALREQ